MIYAFTIYANTIRRHPISVSSHRAICCHHPLLFLRFAAFSNSFLSLSTCALTTISTAVTSPLAFFSSTKVGTAWMSNFDDSS